MTFTQIRDRIADRLGIPATATGSLARIGREINDLYREVTSSIGMDLSRRVIGRTGATSIGSQLVTFSNLEKIERVIDDHSGSVRVLDEVLIDEIMANDPISSDDPRQFAVQSWTDNSTTIRLDAEAETVFNLKADGTAPAATMVGEDKPQFPESFHNVLVEGVLSDEYLRQEKPALADRAQARYTQRLSDLKMWRAKSGYLDITQGKKPRYRGTLLSNNPIFD